MSTPPIVLSIAGSDCSGGAGIQADLKTFGVFGCYGLTVVTAVVAEVPGNVRSIQPITPELVRDQLTILLETFPVAAIKTGMLFSRAIIDAVAEVLGNCKQPPPLIIDPVMVASSGDALLEPDALMAYREKLFPLATLITPNLDELALLAGIKISELTSLEAMIATGKKLMSELGVPLLLKGGHLQDEAATDVLLALDSAEEFFTAPFLRNRETHGTGCTYSAAIAAGLAQGESPSKAVSQAKEFITQAIAKGHQWPGVAALNQSLL